MRLPMFLTGILLGSVKICDLLLLSLPCLLDHLSPATKTNKDAYQYFVCWIITLAFLIVFQSFSQMSYSWLGA